MPSSGAFKLVQLAIIRFTTAVLSKAGGELDELEQDVGIKAAIVNAVKSLNNLTTQTIGNS